MFARNSKPRRFWAAFESLRSQTFEDFELVLSDNASDAEAASLYRAAAARDKRVRLHRFEQNVGALDNFRYVLGAARAPYFLPAADDDERAPTFLERTVALLDGDRDAVAAGSGACLIDDDGRYVAPARMESPYNALSPRVLRLLQLSAPNAMIDFYGLHRTSVIRSVKDDGFDVPEGFRGLDWLMMIQVYLMGRVLRADGELFRYHVNVVPRAAADVAGHGATTPRGLPGARETALTIVRNVDRMPVLESRSEVALVRAVLLSMFTWQGWLVSDRLARTRRDLDACVGESDYLRAAWLGAQYAALSPTTLLRAGPWRYLARRVRGGSEPVP